MMVKATDSNASKTSFIRDVQNEMQQNNVDALVVTSLDEVACKYV